MRTTDPQDEVFPIVNEQDRVIGKITRKEAHKSPHIIHRAIAVLIFDNKKNLLVQRRSVTKDTSPGCWSHGVGGHVAYGEEYLAVAVREIQEELGIEVNSNKLQFLDKIICTSSWEKEMTSVYKLLLKTTSLLHPNQEEVSEIRFVDISMLKEMMKTQEWTPSSILFMNKFIL